MSERGKAPAHLRLEHRVDARHDHAGPGGPLRDDLAPGIDHHAVPVGLPAVRVLSALGRREHPREVFDRAGAQQRLPVRSPGGRGEGRGNEDDVHGRERAIELGKAHVVAHRKRDSPEGRFNCAGLGARFDRLCLVEAFRSELQAEQVDLVVTRDAPPIRVVDEAAVFHLARIVARERHRASHEPHAVPLRGPGNDGCWAGSAPRTSALRRSGTGFSQVPVTRYSNVRAWPTGFFRILSRMNAPRPQIGFTTTARIEEMLLPTEGSTRACRSCVSFTRSTCPSICTCAEGPRILKSFVVIVPLAIFTPHSTRSKANPRPKSSRKSSVTQDCMLRTPMSRAAPGSAFRNCPLYALKSRCPDRVE